MRLRIGELLLSKGLVTEEQLETAVQEQTHTGEFIGEILLRLGYIEEEDFLKVLAQQFETRFVSLEETRVDPEAIKMVPKSLVWEYSFLPLEINANVLLIAVSNPLDMWPMSILQDKLDLVDVRIILARRSDILKAIQKYYGSEMVWFDDKNNKR